VSVVVLIAGLAAGFFVGRATKADPPADLASASAVTLMTDFRNAVDSGDAQRIAQLFTTDAVSVGPGDQASTPTVLVGATRIADSLASLRSTIGLRFTNPGTALQHGDYVTQTVDIGEQPGILVVQLKNGKIQNQWLMVTS
jgi:hypothetical protein